MNFTAILAIISIAIFLGYGAARFVIYPLLGCEDIIVGEENFMQPEKKNSSQAEEDGVVEDGLDIQEKTQEEGKADETNKVVKDIEQAKPTETQNGYYIQFGSFSNKESAQELVDELSNMGITAELFEKEGVYKVRSNLFESKEKAQEIKATLVNTSYNDAFITQ